MSRKLVDIVGKYGLREMLYSQFPVYSTDQTEGRKTSSRTHNALAMRLERRGMVKEAIQIYKQAASVYPPEGYKSFKKAAELAQKNFMNDEAATLWFESIYYAPNFLLKLKSLIKFFRECLRSKTQLEMNKITHQRL